MEQIEHIQTIYRDKNGKEIKEGTIFRVFHFIGSRRKVHYMYKIAAIKDGHLGGMDIQELLDVGREKAHFYRFNENTLKGSEILYERFISEAA